MVPTERPVQCEHFAGTVKGMCGSTLYPTLNLASAQRSRSGSILHRLALLLPAERLSCGGRLENTGSAAWALQPVYQHLQREIPPRVDRRLHVKLASIRAFSARSR